MPQVVRQSSWIRSIRVQHVRAMATALTLVCLLLSTLHWNEASLAGERSHGFGHWTAIETPSSSDGEAPPNLEDGKAPAEDAQGDSPAKKRRSTPLSPVSRLAADAGHSFACLALVLQQSCAFLASSRDFVSFVRSVPHRADPALALHRGQAPPAIA